MVAAQARIEQSLGGERSIPVGRNAWHAERFVTHLPDEFARSFERLPHNRMVNAIAERFERDRAQQVAGLDTPERPVRFLMFEQPAFGISQGAGAQTLQSPSTMLSRLRNEKSRLPRG